MEHTPENPYCEKWDCWCHTDDLYHEDVVDRLGDGQGDCILAIEILGDHSYMPDYQAVQA